MSVVQPTMNRRESFVARRFVSVLALSAASTRGRLRLGPLCYPCALGRSGLRASKREGDGATPQGVWQVRAVYYRADRMPRPRTRLPMHAIRPQDGWCDAPGDANYNRVIRHPYAASAERLWRADSLYDVIVVLAYNERPRVRGRGSAIFVHVARSSYQPTEGCIALSRPHLLRLLMWLRPGSVIAANAKKRPKHCAPGARSTYRGSGVL